MLGKRQKHFLTAVQNAKDQLGEDIWKPWIAVDLDGTLADFDKWRGEEHIGQPIKDMSDKVLDWVSKGKDVRIFTTRANKPEQIALIQDWLERSGLPRLPVTNKKAPGMTEIWDDRAKKP